MPTKITIPRTKTLTAKLATKAKKYSHIATGSIDGRVLERLGITLNDIEKLSPTEHDVFMKCVNELIEEGRSTTAAALTAQDYRWEPVSMERFLNDPYYMGEITKDLFPAWRTALIEAFDTAPKPPVELILGGSIGCGKTTVMSVMTTFMAYRVSCYRNPHEYFGIMPGQPIVIGLYSIDLEQAMMQSYGKVLNWLDKIPYFLQKCPRIKRINSVIKFSGCPLQIIPGSSERHTLGRDMIAFCLARGEKVKTHLGDVAVEALDPSAHLLVAPSGLEMFDRVACVGERDCVEVDVGDGRRVTCSEDHLFLVKAGATVAWRKAIDLQEGDDIVTLDEANYEEFDAGVATANEALLQVWREEANRRRILQPQREACFAV